jgi:hypothetical protein
MGGATSSAANGAMNEVWIGNAECLAGYFPNSSKKCTICPAGSYCPSGSTAANPCPEGTFSTSAGSSTCTPCPAGLWVSTAGSTVCPVTAICQAGFSCNGAGVKSQCPSNNYSFAGASTCSDCLPFSTSTPGADKCSCVNGYYSDSGFSTVTPCTPCPLGSYCVGGVAMPCSKGEALLPSFMKSLIFYVSESFTLPSLHIHPVAF